MGAIEGLGAGRASYGTPAVSAFISSSLVLLLLPNAGGGRDRDDTLTFVSEADKEVDAKGCDQFDPFDMGKPEATPPENQSSASFNRISKSRIAQHIATTKRTSRPMAEARDCTIDALGRRSGVSTLNPSLELSDIPDIGPGLGRGKDGGKAETARALAASIMAIERKR